MNDLNVAVVTGASSGIGRETALAYARSGYAVVLAARRVEMLQQVSQQCQAAGARTLVVPTDVAHEDQVQQLVERTMAQFGRMDVLVNNAGYGLSGRIHELTDRQMRDIFDVNFFGVFYGCRAAAPIMIRQGRGHIFNVSSVIGKRATPFNGGYSATKFAVSGLTEAMRVELREHHVRATLVCPGLTETEFFDKVQGGGNRSSFGAVRGRMSPAAVARKIVAATGKNVPEMVFSAGGKLLIGVAFFLPRLADWMMTFYLRDVTRGK